MGVILGVALIIVGGFYYQKKLKHELMLRNIASSSAPAGAENPLHNGL